IGLPADDRHCYPFYAKCVELGVPLSIHTSANWTTTAVNDLGHPRHLDLVARDFPELKIVMSHAGYPWVLEAVLLAWKYPNVYLELAAHRPKYLAESGTGWEPLLRFGQTTIADKGLFGTGWLLLGRPPAEFVAEFRALPVKPAVMEKWLGVNAARLLGEACRASGAPRGGDDLLGEPLDLVHEVRREDHEDEVRDAGLDVARNRVETLLLVADHDLAADQLGRRLAHRRHEPAHELLPRRRRAIAE